MKRKLKLLIILCICLASTWVFASNLAHERQADEKKTHKILYLTFDDGPTEYTPQLLDILDAHGMKATFFMLETEMKRYPDVVKRIVEEGHGVGVHGVSHEKDIFYATPLKPLEEMDQANSVLEAITGYRTQLARTPYGSSPYLTMRQEQALTDHAYVLWDWNIDSKDWCYRNASKTFNATTKMIQKLDKEPKVVLFHDMKQAIMTMEMMTKWMEANDYTSVPLDLSLQPVKLYRKK